MKQIFAFYFSCHKQINMWTYLRGFVLLTYFFSISLYVINSTCDNKSEIDVCLFFFKNKKIVVLIIIL